MPTPSRKIFRKANVIPTASASILVAMASQLFLSNNVGLSIILDTIIKKFDRRKPFEGTHRTVVCST